MGGRGGSSGRVTMQQVQEKQVALRNAKRNETVAEKAYMKAEGAVRTTPSGRPELLAQRRSARDKAWNKYIAATEKRQAAEADYNKTADRYRRQR